MILVLLLAVVDKNIDFFEKHAPRFNAFIHGGEITTEGDAAYCVKKWTEAYYNFEGHL
jgi:hypothetical protein